MHAAASIDFEQEAYTVLEDSGFMTVCVRARIYINGARNEFVTATVTPEDHTAIEGKLMVGELEYSTPLDIICMPKCILTAVI